MTNILSIDTRFRRQAAGNVPAPGLSRIALIGNFPPRRCGIATFTADTRDALVGAQPGLAVDVYAMDDGQGASARDPGVSHLRQNEAGDYAMAARQINRSDTQIVWLQHEFGIYGGRDGGMVVDFVDAIAVPVIITLHTILEKPSPNQRRIMHALIARADVLIVMAEKGRKILTDCYAAPAAKIRLIPHGIPDRPYVDPGAAKQVLGQDLGFAGRSVILTFGLLSAEKGVGDMIEAMPAITAARPDALYVVLGASHPHVVAHSGSSLRDGLAARAAELGMSDHVRFIDQFVDLGQLTRYLQASDVYVTPYHNPDQITSGTLSYAVGLGKPVVSTGYVHALELLGDGTGILVPFRSPEALAAAVSGLLVDDAKRDQLARRAYRVGRSMTWSRYAASALSALGNLLGAEADHGDATRVQDHPPMYPIIGASALERLTDGTGMLQHSRFGIADRNHGYCIDDNCRALALVTIAGDLPDDLSSRLGKTYAAFVQHAWNPDKAAFRNFMHFDRHWLEDQGSADSNGRTLWSLAVTATRHGDPLLREWAGELYRESSPKLDLTHAPRAQAYAVLAAVEMELGGLGMAHTLTDIRRGCDVLLALRRRYGREGWNWFESVLAYDNCRLPEALIRAGALLGDVALVREGLATLDWVMRLQIAEEGWFRPIGSNSFGRPYAAPERFDQQPIEALAAIEACIAAAAEDGDPKWRLWGEAAFAWFTGANDLGIALGNGATGECCDGLTEQGPNANRGAESVLAWQGAARQILRLRQIAASVGESEESVPIA